ncbi:hypothetical protein [Rhizobium croatiense]|uniref:hypothetical protein n=1 Tax=Rhizobium croatiense TaxID=2867516 RepID=UPI0023EC601D|nr:hypothetical protein [Rhizobium croatiense]WET74111.1 hypothetical protein PYR68_00800 [Rhizobium croatiense]
MRRTDAILMLSLCAFPSAGQAQMWSGICSCYYNPENDPNIPYSCAFDREVLGPTRQSLDYNCAKMSGDHGVLRDPKNEMPTKVAEGPALDFCVPLDPASLRASSPVYELFGEITGKVPACAITSPGERISAVFCYMGNGVVESAPTNKLTAPGCYHFDDYEGCDVSWGTVRGPVYNYITDKDTQIVCVWGEAQPGTGSRYFGILGGDKK